MMRWRRRGFTLIELLVVIAIIGILAAMVFPVFARARESARKTVCLSNVKNIALAIQMYMTDNNDTLPPSEHRQEVWDYFQTGPGGGMGEEGVEPGECEMGTGANPYLRWPVVVDEYIKNRDVWNCPSAKLEGVAGFIFGFPDWLGHLQAGEGVWGHSPHRSGSGLCPSVTYPAGWGGSITDSLLQGRMSWWTADEAAGGAKTFRFSIGFNEQRELKLVEVDDPVNFIICGDCGPEGGYMAPGNTAYPDICALDCAVCDANPDWGYWWDWDNCVVWAGEEGCDPVLVWAPPAFITDPTLRKPYTRHMGGVNLGFLDGHAAWWNSERLLAKMGDAHSLMGLTEPPAPYSWCGYVGDNPNAPVLF